MIKFSHTNSHIKDNLTGLSVASFTFADLCAALSKPKVTLDKLAVGYWVRCLVDGTRNDKNAADESDLLILDGDSCIDTTTGEIIAGAVPAWEVHLVLNHFGIDHFIHTSHSNDVDLRKYRVLIPCHYTRHQLPIILDWIFERLHENGVMLADVKENRTFAQAWFKPSVHPDRKHLFKTFSRIDGIASHGLRDDTEIEFLAALPFDVEAIYNEWLAKQQKLSPVNNQITTLSQNLSANPIKAFNASFSVHDVLIRNGYKQQGKRYLHPNSASKIAGVRILERGAYSDSNDVLNDGRCHDAFDCYRLLECGGDMKAALNWNADLTKTNQRAFFESKNAPLDAIDITPLLQNIQRQSQGVAA